MSAARLSPDDAIAVIDPSSYAQWDGLLDRFDRIRSETPVALADLAAGSGRDTFEWIDTMFDGLLAEGFRFTAVATITSAASSVETLFTWSAALRDRVHYLVVKNRVAGDDFGYFDDTESGRAFMATAQPTVIDLRARAREIQTELDNRGLTPAQMAAADADRRGPLLNGGTARLRAQAYATQIDSALESAQHLLVP